MTTRITAAELLEEDTMLGMGEFCSVCGVSSEWVLDLVEQGVIEPVEPVDQVRGELRFTAVAVHRVSVAYRLQRDLGLNQAGAGVALELLDEVHKLRARLRVLEARFSG